jgi:hypothetical protein
MSSDALSTSRSDPRTVIVHPMPRQLDRPGRLLAGARHVFARTKRPRGMRAPATPGWQLRLGAKRSPSRSAPVLRRGQPPGPKGAAPAARASPGVSLRPRRRASKTASTLLDPIRSDAGQAVPVEVCLAAGDWGWAPFAERESPETSRPDLSCPDLHQRHVSSGSRTEAGWAQLFDRLRQPPTIRVLPFPSSSAACLMPLAALTGRKGMQALIPSGAGGRRRRACHIPGDRSRRETTRTRTRRTRRAASGKFQRRRRHPRSTPVPSSGSVLLRPALGLGRSARRPRANPRCGLRALPLSAPPASGCPPKTRPSSQGSRRRSRFGDPTPTAGGAKP